MRTRLATALAVSTCLSVVACAEPDDEEPEDGFFVEDGKEDDFFSLTAQEYLLEGQATVTIEASLATATAAEKERRVKELIGYRQIAIAWFLTQYMVDKEDDAANASFGGFGGIAKAGAFEDLAVRAIDSRKYEFTFRQIVAGKRDLISLLPTRAGTGGARLFDLEVGTPSNTDLARLETNAEWYRDAPWNDWNPANVAADKKETLTFSIKAEKASSDAWFDYKRLVADGVVDIDVHFGWDYHNAYHEKHARALFDWLADAGFRKPVASFAALTRTSGDFTKTINADGRSITYKVRIFYGKTGTDTDPDTDAGGIVLENDMKTSLRTRDITIFSGHSGPFYGFALANWKKTSEGDLDDADMRVADMPRDRYQIVFAEGCDTYQIGQAFKDNPNKQGVNIDVITTTSFSNAESPAAVQDFITAITARDSRNRLRPQTAKSLLKDLDSNSYWFHTMYGMHGIDDNPALHPFAKAANIGKRCSVNADCGGLGNMCVSFGASAGKRCTAACAADRGCPSSYACKALASAASSTIYANACAPVAP
jgi:hypothetical protein